MKEKRKKKKKKIRVLMAGSDLNAVKGGMVSVSRNYLRTDYWKRAEVFYVATHREGPAPVKLMVFASALFRILVSLLRRKADVVLLNVSERGSFYRKALLMRLCHFFHVPVVFHHHGAEFNDFYGTLSANKKKYVQKILTRVDLNIVLSQSQEKDILEKAPAARVDYLYNAIDVRDENPYSADACYIITMGRLGERKGTYDLLKALKDLDSELPDFVKAAFCGDGETEEVKALVKRYGLQKRVFHVGWIDGEKKEKCLARAMMHVLPSYREVLPMSILETMARGIPNISTRIAAVPEVIEDGVNGFLITPGDIGMLEERIRCLVSDQKLRSELSERAHQTIRESFSLKQNVRKMERLLLSVVDKYDK